MEDVNESVLQEFLCFGHKRATVATQISTVVSLNQIWILRGWVSVILILIIAEEKLNR